MTRRRNGRLMPGQHTTNRLAYRLLNAPEPMADMYPGDGERNDEARKERLREHTKRIRSHEDYEDPPTSCNRGRAKLSDDDVREIRNRTREWERRERVERGRIRRELAARYGVNRITISNIALRKTWGRLD